MSAEEEQIVDAQEEEQEEVAADEGGDDGPVNPLDCIQAVLKNALIVDGLARGLRECARALDRREAELCLLAQDCDEPAYGRLVEALCSEHSISLIKVPESKDLGAWAGLCKIDREGNARKVVACSCVVVKDFGEESDALRKLRASFEA